MPPTLDDDDINTITVKGEEDEHRAPRRPSWSPSSPDSMSPMPLEPAGLAAAVHAASPRHLQSPEPLEDDHHRRNSNGTPNQHNHHNHRNNHNHNHNTLPHTQNHRPLSPPQAPIHHAHAHAQPGPDAASLPHPPPASTLPAPHHSNKRPRPNVMTTEERLLAMPEKRPMPWRPGVDAGADIETGGESRRKQIRFGCLLATRGDVVSAPCVSCANGRGKFSICVADPSLFRGACAGCQLSGRPNRCSIKQSDDAPSPNASTPESTTRNVKKKLSKSQHSPLMSKPDQRLPDEAPTWHNGSPKWPQQEYIVPQSHPQPDPSAVAAAAAAAASQPRWATVNPPHPPPPPPPQPQQQLQQQPIHPPPPSVPSLTHHHRPTNGVPILPPANPPPSRSPMGWATINRPPPPPSYTIEAITTNGTSTSNTTGGGGVGGPFTHRAAREDTGGNDSNAGSAVIIDTLPKNKQRQVYGVLSGLQAGIEHLQRELDALKRTLGVEDED